MKITRKKFSSLRRNQMVTNFGVGAIVDFPDQSLMGCNIEEWGNKGEKIHDTRLEKILKVDHFRLPPSNNPIPYVRFPKWHFCISCRELKKLGEWRKSYVKKYNKDWEVPTCPSCNLTLIPSRFIVICEQGHIDDFPWVEWVHREKKCDNPRLEIKTAGSSSGLEGIQLSCKTCGKKTNMKHAFDKDILGRIGIKCSGNRPWDLERKKDECDGESVKLIIAHRGGSNVYFPKIISSIYIPSKENEYIRKLEHLNDWNYITNPTLSDEQFNEDFELFTKRIAKKTEIDETLIRNLILQQRHLLTADDEKIDYFQFRYQEYDAFLNQVRQDPNFKTEKMDVHDYKIPWLENIVLVKKLREVRTLIGFTRVSPPEQKNFYDDFADEEDNSKKAKLVYVKKTTTNWYPAMEVKGEGIFFTIKESYLKKWSEFKSVRERVKSINEKYQDLVSKHGFEERNITAEFIFLHTLAHLLIRELSFSAGYGSASLREKIYCNETDNQPNMKGVLIYTASGDSEGTLGGLVRLGKPDIFPSIVQRALEKAEWCSNDPICFDSKGQGIHSMNLAACHFCSLLPETSCEVFNWFLDRGLVIGLPEDQKLGFINQEFKD